MHIEISAIGAWDRVNSFDLDDLFEHVATEEGMIRRLGWRIKAWARIVDVGVDYIQWNLLEIDGDDFTPPGDAIERYQDVAKFYNWKEGQPEDSVLPILALLHKDHWKYLDFDDLDGEAERCYHRFEQYEYAEFAKDLVDEGFLEVPGEEWGYYINWEAKGRDVASEYEEYAYDGITYLFGS